MGTKSFNRIGMVARWKPVHLGHLPVLHALCEQAEHALIGIGSSNRYNARNPFTVDETTDMLNLVLASYDNYTLIPVPDLDDGPRWRLMILDLFGPLDAYVTANPYVAHLLIEDYDLIKPVALVAEAHRIAVDGTMVRLEMARGGDWQALVPPEIAHYILENQLDERFRREFGLETLALEAVVGRQ
jgi:nicotinamide-nucleotide adenylyltransferase